LLDRKWLLTEPDAAAAALARRGEEVDLAALMRLDAQRRQLLIDIEADRHARKLRSKEIGKLKRAGEDTAAAQVAVREVGERIASREATLKAVEAELSRQLLRLPNVPLPEVADGRDADDNVEIRRWGTPAEPAFAARPHWELGEALGLMAMQPAAATSGARFAFMTGMGARLELALAHWMFETHVQAGYTPTVPPYLVRGEALQGTGQLPKFADDLFKVEGHDLYLIPTAEVPVTNFHAGEVLSAEALPQAWVAFSPCFRAEAGAAGQDTRGIIRVHQFHKVELVRVERPQDSPAALVSLTQQAESILQALALPYRVLELCAGDLGFGAARTYDLEVWLPGQQRWLEVSSCSTFTDFQARRAGIRYRPAPDAKPAYVHTLNGSGLAVGRTLVAILEHYQTAEGAIEVPEVLRPWLKADKIQA